MNAEEEGWRASGPRSRRLLSGMASSLSGIIVLLHEWHRRGSSAYSTLMGDEGIILYIVLVGAVMVEAGQNENKME